MIVAATLAPLACTKSTPSRVVMCSSTSFSAGKSAQQRRQHALDEHRLAVEDVDRRIGDLAMHQQRQAERFHARQRRRGTCFRSVTPASELVVAPAG